MLAAEILAAEILAEEAPGIDPAVVVLRPHNSWVVDV